MAGRHISVFATLHPEMVLGTWSRKNRMYGGQDGYSLTSNGDLATQLREAVERLPRFDPIAVTAEEAKPQDAFVPPPAQKHVSEGSFFVAPDRTIHQVVAGQGVPVKHGNNVLSATRGVMGMRMAALINLVDLDRRVLQSQNEGWPAEHREKARKDLNRAYDHFHATYGPINKTTFSETAEGTVIRRMPNLVRFREDPNAMLVMALENYDEATGTATKAAIMSRDVVGKTPPVTSVASAEEGLLVSLDQRGGVDLPFIASLYGKPEASVVQELGDLIYHDPETKRWETADVYLSGNVRAKLAAAEAAGPEYAPNAVALRSVQPEDVLPGDISAKLGAPWIPESDVQAFATHLFGVSDGAVQVAHLPRDAVWSVEADYSAVQSVAATTDYGTAKANGTVLLDQALNMKTPVIYDTISTPDGDQRVVNQEETLAAREKQKKLKEAFRSWIFSDPERTERLVRTYNDTYNNLRPRLFDGSHLVFPGMNSTMELKPHQENAIWRCMSSGNTLLSHCVGAGKTYEMMAAAMKMKQAGLIKKPLLVVPNHLLDDFGREWQKLYPNARLLIANQDDFTKERRKLLTAKIASQDWDGIIVTHSSFERVGMSKDYQEQFLREQIKEYDELLHDSAAAKSNGAKRNIIKTIEKQKGRREARLKDLLAEDKKDDGLVFDELGVDHVFVDEAHYFKNLETPTKMERVAGIQTGGSERAFDLYMKARFLDQRHRGRGITFATATPITNTLGEMYTMSRFLDPAGLESRGLGHFDAWAAAFGEVTDAMEISPDGSGFRPRSRFAKFTNLPELQQMFRAYADVQTPDMLNLPRPALETGKAIVVACEMSDDQAEIQRGLIARYDRIRSQKVDPREDNALAITTDGRKLALDARLISRNATDHPNSKINALVDRVAGIWQRTADTRGTQMIFGDMGVNPTAWGFSAYDDMITKLVARGIPREQIAVMGDADSDAKKQALFEKVRSGSVRILLGSTQKMGTGTNVQKRLVALHHLDAPWKPAEVEQREGRILRQGNDNPEVAIYRYVTKGSFDAYMWQALETKARFIGQVLTGDNALRQAEDVGGQELSYAEVKAIASGNPAVLTLADTDGELQRLSILRKNHHDEQYLAGRSVRTLPGDIERLTTRLTELETDRDTLRTHVGDPLEISGQAIAKADVMAALGRKLDGLPEGVSEIRRVPLGRYQGLAFGIVLHPHHAPDIYLEGATSRLGALSREHQGPRAVLNALERLADSYGKQCDTTKRDLDIATAKLRDFKTRIGAAFPHESFYLELTELRDRLKLALTSGAENGGTSVAELAEQIAALRAANTIEAAPVRTASKPIAGEEPVTTRIRRRAEPTVDVEPPAAPAVPVHNDEAQPVAIPLEPAAPATAETPVEPASDIPVPEPSRTDAIIKKLRSPIRRASEIDAPVPTVSLRMPSVSTPEAQSTISIGLTGEPDGPRMQLLRSLKYKQLQIRVDGPPLADQYRAAMRKAGWIDRTASLGMWTKQIPDGQWEPVAEAERFFKHIANCIRRDNQLEPVRFVQTAGRQMVS